MQPQRMEVLKALYAKFKADPDLGWVYREKLVELPGVTVFDLAYLVKRGLVEEKRQAYLITADGIDRVEAEQP